MTRSRLGLMGLCAVIFGVMAMSASSAQAALSWLVLNSAGTTATELKAELVGEKDSEHITLLSKLLSGGINVAITCTNFELIGVNLEVGGLLTTGGKVKFTGCEAYEKAPLTTALACKVHSAGQAVGVVESLKGKGGLVLHEIKVGEKEVLTKIEPEVGTTFATFLTEGCSLPESNPVNGVLYVKDCEALKNEKGEALPCDKNALVHSVKHLIEQGPLTSLWVGKDTAEHLETSVIGSAWIKLAGAHAGLKWSAMDA
jgi:hypothetical protein